MRRALVLLLGLLVGGSLASAGAEGRSERSAARAPTSRHSPVVEREALETLEAQLDRTVDRVSLPRIAGLLARNAARGYRLPGYGVVFVLTPRALPGGGRDRLLRLAPPRHRTGAGGHEADGPDQIPPEVETLERHVAILQNETEQARRVAEQDMARIVHDMRLRLAAVATPAAPTAHAADAPPASAEPLPGPPPPWKYWFQSGGTRDARTQETVVAEVKQALVGALGSRWARVPGLRPEEYVTVAVDFEEPDPFAARARPARTLVVRARARDIEARAKRAIDREEFRRRLEVIEY